MKLLRDLLFKAGLEEVHGSTNLAVEQLSADSRNIKKNGLYCAIQGLKTDGHSYINKAIESGAIAIVCEQLPEQQDPKITYVRVRNSRQAWAWMAANFYDHPSHKLKLVGITGTNGKTSVATGLYQLFSHMGYQTGLISTVENKIANTSVPATHTTPDALGLNQLLEEMVTAGITHCFMEVSSHALDQARVAGIQFAGAIFTNISHDHLDYHKTMDNYIRAKKQLFDMLPEESWALVNVDDKRGRVMLQNCKAKDQKGFALMQATDFKGKIIENLLGGLFMSFNQTEVSTQFTGSFNAYNLLAIFGAARLMGKETQHVLTTLSTLKPPPGRFQTISIPTGAAAIVDYAHTPDALESVLQTLKETMSGQGRILCVIGCGGDRDPSKRPIMGKIASGLSHKAILTSDNPRSEDPVKIIEEMQAELSIEEKIKCLTIPARQEAISAACRLAEPGDVVLIAGKGHETYQEINGERHHFDDVEEVKRAFGLLNSKED